MVSSQSYVLIFGSFYYIIQITIKNVSQSKNFYKHLFVNCQNYHTNIWIKHYISNCVFSVKKQQHAARSLISACLLAIKKILIPITLKNLIVGLKIHDISNSKHSKCYLFHLWSSHLLHFITLVSDLIYCIVSFRQLGDRLQLHKWVVVISCQR